jgi:hypothetical protein
VKGAVRTDAAVDDFLSEVQVPFMQRAWEILLLSDLVHPCVGLAGY